MDDIRRLRNLLHECDKKVNFKKYDERIMDYYNKDFQSQLSQFKYNESKVNLKVKLDDVNFDYNEYIHNLLKLKKQCQRIVDNRISLEFLKIPSHLYKNCILQLDNNENIIELINLLQTFNKSGEIYTNLKYLDFEILTFGVKTKVHHKKISAKRKYRKWSREDIIKDVLKKHPYYYIDGEEMNTFFAYKEKKHAKQKIKKKYNSVFLKFIFLDVVPALVIWALSMSFMYRFAFIGIGGGRGDGGIEGFSSSLISGVFLIGIFIFVIWLEAYISRTALISLPILQGVKSYWITLFVQVFNFFCFVNSINVPLISIFVFFASIFYGFYCGPNFRHKEVRPFSLSGRLLVGLTVMDFYLIVCLSSSLLEVILGVIIIFSALVPLELKRVEKSPWYGKR